MFTGIVERTAEVTLADHTDGGLRLSFSVDPASHPELPGWREGGARGALVQSRISCACGAPEMREEMHNKKY